MVAPRPEDMKAGFTGLIVAVVLLFVAIFGIVKLTNAKYAHPEPAAAATPK